MTQFGARVNREVQAAAEQAVAWDEEEFDWYWFLRDWAAKEGGQAVQDKVIRCRVCGCLITPENVVDAVECPDECVDCAEGEFPNLFGE